MEKESISIALCTYNGERFLRQQLDSIAGQTRPPDELVILDDRSSDGTVGIIEDFSRRMSFPVRWAVNDRNLGSTKNFEKAIGACSGSLIVLSDQDDLWMPEKLEYIERAFLDSPDIGAVFSNGSTVDENSDPLGHSLWESVGFTRKEQGIVADGRVLEVLLRHDIATGASMAFRASLRPAILPIPEQWVHDAWIAMLAVAVSALRPIDRPLIRYRIHRGQQVGGPREPFMAKVAREAGNIRASRKKALEKAKYDRSLELSRYGSAYDRLVELQCDREPVLRGLSEKTAHLRSRIRIINSNRLVRALLISRELASRKYHRYSYGLYSALKDLVV